MNQPRSRKWAAATVAGIAAALTIYSPARAGDNPATQPSTPPTTRPLAKTPLKPVVRPELGEIEVSGYCTMLLAPKLRKYLDLTASQRVQAESLNTRLKAVMDNCASPSFTGPELTPGVISSRIRIQLAEFGHKVRDMLTPAQDRKLVDLFNSGDLTPINVAGKVDVGRTTGGKGYMVGSYSLDYTHYGEDGTDDSNSDDTPSTPRNNNGSRQPRSPVFTPHLNNNKSTEAGQPARLKDDDAFAAPKVTSLADRFPCHRLAYSAGGKLLVAVGGDGVKIWSTAGDEPAVVADLGKDTLGTRDIQGVALSPDCRMLAIGGADNNVQLFDLTGTEPKQLDSQGGLDKIAEALCFSSDGTSLYSGGGQIVVHWKIASGHLQEISRCRIDSIFGVKNLSVGAHDRVLCATGTGQIDLVNFSTRSPVIQNTFTVEGAFFNLPMATSPVDDTVLFGSGKTVIRSGKTSQTFATGYKETSCVAWSPDAKYFACGTRDGHLLIWDSAGKLHYDYLREHALTDIAIMASPANALVIAVANEDNKIQLLQFKTDTAAPPPAPVPPKARDDTKGA